MVRRLFAAVAAALLLGPGQLFAQAGFPAFSLSNQPQLVYFEDPAGFRGFVGSRIEGSDVGSCSLKLVSCRSGFLPGHQLSYGGLPEIGGLYLG